MKIIIGSRQSDLARLQAYAVAHNLKNKFENLEIDFHFRESFGDQNLDDPLANMGNKGVFTEDFHQLLVGGDVDLVVHSWKDLPIEERAETQIIATLDRADSHDVVLFKKSAVSQMKKSGKVCVLTSSPRRTYHLEKNLGSLLPFAIENIEFKDVRGNIPTRLNKFLTQEVHADAFVVAKAALDRLLSPIDSSITDSKWGSEFQKRQKQLKMQLKQCQFMILPFTFCPPAPAQGALAIEIKKGHQLSDKLAQLNQQQVFKNVVAERRILSEFGGGCHLKIGAHFHQHRLGVAQYIGGQTPEGSEFASQSFQQIDAQEVEVGNIRHWPRKMSDIQFFHRSQQNVPAEHLERQDLFIARENALPAGYIPSDEQLVWCSGVKSWEKLANRGIWVHGCNDSLGGAPISGLELMTGREIKWIKLTHDQSNEDDLPQIHTYSLSDREDFTPSEDFKQAGFYFWPSGTTFLKALQHYPELKTAFHACGPGQTYDVLRANLASENQVSVFLNYESWLQWVQSKDRNE